MQRCRHPAKIGLTGHIEVDRDVGQIAVGRALTDWGLPRGTLRNAWSTWQKSRRLRPRLEREAARRGQRLPTYDEIKRLSGR